MPKRKAATVDFDDEKSVLRAMAKELEFEADEIESSDRFKIKESHYSSFTGDTYWLIEIGSQEYYVAKNNDSAYDLAVAMVKQDLEENPEIFNQSFIEGHIDMKRLRDQLWSDTLNSNHEYYREMSDGDLKREVEGRLNLDEEEFLDEDGEFKDVDEIVEKLAEDLTEEQLKEPMDYLEDIFGKEDAVKKAIEIAGIDEDAAAEEAVDTDGMGHFLSPYDGEYHEGPDGIIWWRHN